MYGALSIFKISRIFQSFRCASSERTEWSSFIVALPVTWCTDKYLHTGHYHPIGDILQILIYQGTCGMHASCGSPDW